MTLINKDKPIVLGNSVIDNDHQVFIDLLNALESAGNLEFTALFQQLYEHTEQHFEHEKQLMQQSAFPAENEHSGEHQRVLGEFKQFKTRMDKGLISFGRSFVKERLPQWFQLHVTTMDSALVTHLNAKHASKG
ncbi:hemerythrin domain-containing protein [Methylomonas sp. AM2-LC]|uniref:bacteriohemerythrin n=1 Tax=Methylomonas sp. AM2-LC TaxID=3153301 RepID=UPI003263FCF8